jgi:hypothetical protein
MTRFGSLLLTACLCTALLTGGCSGFTEPPPPMADSTLAVVLVDLHLAKARAEHEGTRIARDSVLRHHGVRPPVFEETLDYYVRHPNAYATIYERVIDSLRSLQSGLRMPSSRQGAGSGSP